MTEHGPTEADKLLLDCAHLLVDLIDESVSVDQIAMSTDALARRLRRYFIKRGLVRDDEPDLLR